MATLTNDQKTAIVVALACYQPVALVQRQVQEDFGLSLTTSQVVYYDPSNARGAGLGKKWQDLFKATRRAYLEDLSDVHLASRAGRMKELVWHYQQAKVRGNTPICLQIVEQCAKEMGNAYEKKQDGSLDDAAPRKITVEVVNQYRGDPTRGETIPPEAK